MKKLGVFYGGKSCEHEVSVITALQAMAELEGYFDICPIYVTESGWYSGEELKNADSYKDFEPNNHCSVFLVGNKLYTKRKLGIMKLISEIDCAFICMHGGIGEGGGISGLMEMNGISYTCARLLQSSVCLDKEYFKIIAKHKGFKVVPWIVVNKDEFEEDEEKISKKLYKKYGNDVIVKPIDMGSSIGVNTPRGAEEIRDALSLVFCYTSRAIVEKKITDIIELNCAVCRLGEVVAVSAIERPYVSKGEVLSYKDKYLTKYGDDNPDREIPAKISPSLATRVRRTTQSLYESLGLDGVVRVDYIYKTETDELFVNEVNTIPGSMGGYLFEKCGINYVELVSGLVQSAENRLDKDKEFLTHFSSELLSGKYFVSK